MKSVLLFFILAAFAQAPIEPVRISIITSGEDAGLETQVRSSLNKLRYVVISERRPDWRVVIAASKDKCGYVAALVVVDPQGKSQLSIHTSDKTETLAAHIVEKLQREYFRNK